MNPSTKVALSIVVFFVAGAYQSYLRLPVDVWPTGRMWLDLVMAGLWGAACYLIGYWQLNPANQPQTAGDIVKAVEKIADKVDAPAVLAAGAVTLQAAADTKASPRG